MKRIVFIMGLLFSSATIHSVYNVGTIDSISGTNNGGTGYGNATQASAVGYVTTAISTNNINIFGSAIQPDGKTVVVGKDVTTSVAVIARYNINGTLDTATFNASTGYITFSIPSATSTVANGVTVLPNGKIVVVGSAIVSGSTQFFVAQFLPTGALDTTGSDFASGVGYVYQANIHALSADVANAVTVDSSGNIYVVGTSTQASYGNIFIAKYDSTGALLTGSYNSGAVVGGTGAGFTTAGIAMLSILTTSLTGNGVVIDAAGKLVVSGSASSDMIVTRFLTTGLLDTTGNSGSGFNQSVTPGYNAFSVTGSGVAYGVGVQSATNSNRIIVAGTNGTIGATGNGIIAGITNAGVLDTGTFGTSSSGYISSVFGYSAAAFKGLAIQSNDKILVGGSVFTGSHDYFLIARYLSDGSALDTTNFANPNGYTVTDITAATGNSFVNAISLQQNGDIITAGNVHLAAVDIEVARYLGDIPQGCMDYTYNPSIGTSPGAPGFRTYPTDSTATDLPKVTAIYPAASGTLYALSSETGSTNSQLVKLNSDGTTASAAVVIAQPKPNDVITDSQNRAVVVGTTSTPNGFIARYTSTGAMTIDGTFASGTVVAVGDSASLVRVCEQGSSRLVAIGQQDATTSVVIAYTESGALDFTFGFSGTPGYNTENGGGFGATFNDMIIDANDGIYIAYQVAGGSYPHIWIDKFLANGSGLDGSSFATNTDGQVDTGLVSTSYNVPCLSFDNNGNIVVATTNILTGTIVVQSYAPVSTSAPIVNSCSITTTITL